MTSNARDAGPILLPKGEDMIVLGVARTFPARAVEWLISGILVSWGVFLLTHPQLFAENPVFDNLDQTAPQYMWGGMAVMAGIIRATALWINGHWTRTPMIRVITSFVSAFIWTQVFLGVAQSRVDAVQIVLYPWFIAGDIYSALRAASDAYRAYVVRLREKQVEEFTHGRGSRGA